MKFMDFTTTKNLNTSEGCAVNHASESQPIYLRFTEKVMGIPNSMYSLYIILALDYSVWLAHIDMYKTIAVFYNSYVS